LTNFISQSDFSTDYGTYNVGSASAEMLSTNLRLVTTNSTRLLDFGSTNSWNYQYIINNLTVTNFNHDDNSFYGGVSVWLSTYVGTTNTVSDAGSTKGFLCKEMTIGPNQTVQLISKDAPIVMGYVMDGTFGGEFGGSNARMWTMYVGNVQDNIGGGIAELHFHCSYLKISRASST
jgi:hypothetical protein